MKNLLNSIKVSRPNSNTFDLSHDVKLSFNMGQLVPILVMDCVPGDRINLSCQTLLRLAPLATPMMQTVKQFVHYFFVPNRLVWENWEAFITNTPDANTGLLPAFPTITVYEGTTAAFPLADYMGVPNGHGGVQQEKISAIPFAAYQMIYNDYYRDQNLVPEIEYQLQDGAQNVTVQTELLTLRNRAWMHDYFTSALPWAQKGQPVNLPIGQFNDVPVKANRPIQPPLSWQTNDGNTLNVGAEPANISTFPDGLYADTSQLVTQSTTINDLRTAFRLQEWLEKMARGGSRYIEQIRNFFGVNSSDRRLQRPEYITGTQSPVVISEVLNTTGTTALPQGNMAGHGISTSKSYNGSYYCEEHGYIIGIMSVMPDTAYFQGLPKHFLKTTDPFEFYWPQFAHIGEQSIENRELYAFTSQGDQTFGYLPRYTEYKYYPSRVCGDFRTTLKNWHMAREFASLPALNAAFITSDPTHRTFAVTNPNDQKLYCHFYNAIKAKRPMPKYGTPTF